MPTTAWSAVTLPLSVSTATVPGEAFVRDNFDGAAAGSDLSLHVGEIGSGWSIYNVTNINVPTSLNDRALISSAGRVYHGVGDEGAYYQTRDVPPSADYRVVANITRLSTQPVGIVDLLLRVDSSGSDIRYGARCSQDAASQEWVLYKVVNDNGAGLSGVFADTIVPGTSRQAIFAIQGSRMTLTIDGVVRLSASDSSITKAGRAAISIATYANATARSTDTQGLHLDSFVAEALSSITTAYGPVPAWSARAASASTWRTASPAAATWSALT